MAKEDKKTAGSKERKKETTVRKRKESKKVNTQRYIPFSEIRNDTVILKNGGLRAVLLVEPLNFNLKSETEQQGIIAGYESFINTLSFPIQIVLRSSKLNIDPYIEHIHEQVDKQKNELLKKQTLAYSLFIEKIVEIADIMQKRFYVIVPLDDVPKKKSPLGKFFTWFNLDDTLGKALQRNKKFTSQVSRLKERLDLVETGLRNIGLTAKRLKTTELINLYYQIYNPDVSQTQKLPGTGELNVEANVL